MFLVIFVGQSGTGKSTVAKMLVQDNQISSGSILLREVKKQGLAETHANIHKVAMEKIAQDPAWQAKQVLKMAEGKEFFVFDGPRNPFDVEFFVRWSINVKVVGFIAPYKVRYQRILKREHGNLDSMSFFRRCANEAIDAGLHDCLRKVDILAVNAGHSLRELKVLVLDLQLFLSGNKPNSNYSLALPADKNFPYNLRGIETILKETNQAMFLRKEVQNFLDAYLKFEKAALLAFRHGRTPTELLGLL